MIGNKQKNKKGFSLIEVLVSVSLFVVIILSATEIFRLVINGQRSAIASQNVQESMKYFFEVIGKEMRMAKRNSSSICPDVPIGEIFVLSSNTYGSVLKFRNYYDECVAYYIALDGDNQRFKIERNIPGRPASGFISPAKIRIDSLVFAINQTGQPVVTVNIQAWATGENRIKSEMDIQTSVTSRYYK